MQQAQIHLPIKSVVGERYQIEELLGQGGFGAVYLVRDLRVQQNVFALKEVMDPVQQERRHFTFEADLLKRTDHPSLPRVYRAFDDPVHARAYMLMDYVEGTNLEKLRRQQTEKRFSLSEVLAFMGPIAEAVSYLHAQQPPIIHRDIKPSNIIAPTSGERTMLVDFGIAKEFDQEATTTAIRHATPGYGAPEQYGTGTDTRTDIYGIGATLYTLLTGTTPTDAFFRMTQQMSKDVDPLLPAIQVLPTIPAHVSAAISRAMALEKSARFANVDEFWQALLSDSQQLPVAIPPENVKVATPSVVVKPLPPLSAGRAAPWSSRRGRWVLLALLLILALGIGFAAALSLPGLHPQQASSAATGSRTANTQTARPGSTAPSAIQSPVNPTSQPTAHPTTRPTSQPPSQPTSQPTSRPTSRPTASVPALNSTYSGTIHDNNGSIDTNMSLQGITQNGQSIRGMFYVSQPLNGNGAFTGTVKSDSSVQFTVHSSDPGAAAPLFFSGKIQQDGSMSGQYCSLDATNHCNPAVGGYGTWSVRPNQNGS
ncbi:MAG TPA: protein kinase [Ktedonobacteraceae bacterium]